MRSGTDGCERSAHVHFLQEGEEKRERKKSQTHTHTRKRRLKRVERKNNKETYPP
jgi:hypothetical protein